MSAMDEPSTSGRDDVAPRPPSDRGTGVGEKRKLTKEQSQRVAKYARGDGVATKRLKDKKLRGQLRHSEHLASEAAHAAARAEEWLLPEEAGLLEAEGMERTWRFSQEDIVKEVPVGAGAKVFDLNLPDLGPYSLDFTRSGRYMLLGGRKGHLALMDWQLAHLITEVQVRETTRDVKFLHNEMFFAAAQKKYTYIYDKRGVEIHCLKEHSGVRQLEFLPYHFLLCSIGDGGVLRYQDTSTGLLVAQHHTKMGPCAVMRQNPYNACISLGHANGVVSMWSPNVTAPLVKMLCHRGPVRAVAMDGMGQHMVTAGADGEVKVWDIRTFKPLHAYFSRVPATSLDISQRGLLAVGSGSRVQIWKDALLSKQASPYMTHTIKGGALQDAHFCPYEDMLGVGHGGGVSTMLVPGAGEPNFDSRVADPYQAKRARREQEVHQLLDKLRPEMIVLDPTTIGQIRKEPKEARQERLKAEREANAARRKMQEDKNDGKSKMKGKNKPSRRYKKKQSNIIEERKGDVRQRMREEVGAPKDNGPVREATPIPENVPRALHRFYRKGAGKK